MRGETEGYFKLFQRYLRFQSTLPMRGETPAEGREEGWKLISIHSPHAGRDGLAAGKGGLSWQFQSTLPMRGETNPSLKYLPTLKLISIHSPHAGRDQKLLIFIWQHDYFNPLSPCGERPWTPRSSWMPVSISIHSPHAGRDDFEWLDIRIYR